VEWKNDWNNELSYEECRKGIIIPPYKLAQIGKLLATYVVMLTWALSLSPSPVLCPPPLSLRAITREQIWEDPGNISKAAVPAHVGIQHRRFLTSPWTLNGSFLWTDHLPLRNQFLTTEIMVIVQPVTLTEHLVKYTWILSSWEVCGYLIVVLLHNWESCLAHTRWS
jgi:hypothetical protein